MAVHDYRAIYFFRTAVRDLARPPRPILAGITPGREDASSPARGDIAEAPVPNNAPLARRPRRRT